MTVVTEFEMYLEEYLSAQGLDVTEFSDEQWTKLIEEFYNSFENHLDRCAKRFFEYDGKDIRTFAEGLLE